MFFHRSHHVVHKEPIELAHTLLYGAMSLAYSYLHNKNVKISAEDLKMIDMFVEEIHMSYATASYISRCLHQRSHGELEGSAKFTNKKAFDWHYPE